MHSHSKEQLVQSVNNQILQVDFHDFLQKAAYMQDLELSQEVGLTVDQTRLLRNKWQQSRR